MSNNPTLAFFDTTADDRKYYYARFKKSGHIYFSHIPIQDDAGADLKSVEILSVHVASSIGKDILDQMPHLKLITTRATGYDNIDLKETKRRNITVCNVPGYGANAVAEYSFMLLLALSRKLILSTQQMITGNIDHTLLTGTDLAGKVLGVIGTGNIGKHIARIANGFEMKVIAFDPYPNQSLEFELNLRYCSLEKLLESSDIISLHAPYTKDNHHLIDTKAFDSMKEGVMLINTARGELVDTKALVSALISGRVGGAALDVLEGEKIFQTNEEIELLSHPVTRSYEYALENLILEKMPNVILSPHNAFNSIEAIKIVQDTTAENISKFLTNVSQNVITST